MCVKFFYKIFVFLTMYLYYLFHPLIIMISSLPRSIQYRFIKIIFLISTHQPFMYSLSKMCKWIYLTPVGEVVSQVFPTTLSKWSHPQLSLQGCSWVSGGCPGVDYIVIQRPFGSHPAPVDCLLDIDALPGCLGSTGTLLLPRTRFTDFWRVCISEDVLLVPINGILFLLQLLW